MMKSTNLQENIDYVISELGNKSTVVIKHFYIGKGQPLDAVIIYVNVLVNKDIIDRDILSPLMLHVQENLTEKQNLADYLCRSYIAASNTRIETDSCGVVNDLKRGKTTILIDGISEAIVLDTTGGEYRSITEPKNETSVKGPREGFIENLETNLSILRRAIKDKNLVAERFTLGRRSQKDGLVLYLQDIADLDMVNKIKTRIDAIDVDKVTDIGIIQQYIEDYTYSIFPQTITTERPDVAASDLMEGKIVIIFEGTPAAMTAPATFIEFFQAVEDYYQRTIASSFIRLIRILAVIIVITLPSIYLTLMKFNAELIPVKFVTPIIQSRIGIALTPFMEIVSMEIIVEFLREGGLRLPSKIGQTLSVVGGIIIGDTAVKSKIVSPTTLFIVGIAVISNFLIPNYDMAISVRIIRFPMLILSNFLGIFGIGIGWFLIVLHLCSLDSFGVPYFELKMSDMKDIFIRAPLWKFNKRPESVPNNNPIRQTDFRNKWKKKE